jgi:acyl CoA:acetate/3-ketoacid CoA transferase alpha subunit
VFGPLKERVGDKVDLAGRSPARDKVMDLRDAVRRLVRPGMHLHIAHSYNRSNAAVHEICRRFWGKAPGFTISALGFTSNMVLLVHGGLVRRIITAFCGDPYPFPGPNPIYQEAFESGRVEIRNWTVLTLPQRLLAAALGVEWMPTHSLTGSTMAEENREDFRVVEGPDREPMGMVRALHPDLTIVHGWAADQAGNVLMAPPYAENAMAAYASRGGVLATVERIVDAGFLKRHAAHVKVPGYLVEAVCPASMGAHPAGISDQGLGALEPYAEDEAFLLGLRAASRDPEALTAWARHWVLECEDHDEYIRRLGHERVWSLKGKAASDSWMSELASRAPEVPTDPQASPMERMVVAASRLIVEKVLEKGHRTILAGIGAANLAAWKAYYDLRRQDHDAELMAEVGFFGYAPRPGDPFIFNFRNLPTSTMLADILTVLGSMVGASTSRCIGVLGAGQVDRFGNINSTRIPAANLFLVGSGGACDVALGAREVLVTIPLGKLRCVEQVGYVTAPGARVRTVVTDEGVFEKREGEAELRLTALLAKDPPRSPSEAVAEIASRCGWEIRVAPELREIPRPTREELMDVRIFDPRRYFLEG